MLVEIDGGVTEVLCAEPAIRGIKESRDVPVRITICCRECDLFRNHPAVDDFSYTMADYDKEKFGWYFSLPSAEAIRREGAHPVVAYADQLDVELTQRRPWICLDGMDFAAVQRFGTDSLEHPRIAVAAHANGDAWGEDSWRALGQLLCEKLHAGLVQFGREGDRFLGVGKNLIGRVSAREAATVLRMCDLLICGDNEYLDLAAATQTPAVVVPPPEQPDLRFFEGAAMLAVPGQGDDISVDDVIETIAMLCERYSRSQD